MAGYSNNSFGTTGFRLRTTARRDACAGDDRQNYMAACCEEAFEQAFTAVGSISDCRNLQLSDGSTVTVQPQADPTGSRQIFLPFTGTSPGGGGTGASLGCFRDMADFDLKGYLEQGQSNTVERCVQTCKEKGFAYAGVQYGMSCLCGNSYGKYGPAANCDYKCTGNQSEICGGYAANSVYATGVPGGQGKVGGNQPNCNPIKYNQKAQSYRGRTGEKINLCCPADSIAQGSIYGTDIYTDDSWICTAAIHAGIISPGVGGPLTLEVRPGQDSYIASTRHGVSSGGWSGYGGSFTFVGLSGTTTNTGQNQGHEPPIANPPKNPPSQADIDLSGSWHARDNNNEYSMEIKRISAYEFGGTWKLKSFSPAGGEDSYNVRVVTEGEGHGKLYLPFYSYEMTYTANQIVAGGNTYTR